MYAIVQDRSRCLTLTPGQELWVDLLDAEAGSEIVFDKVQLLSNDGDVTVGVPHVAGASVVAEVIGNIKDKKILVSTFKRRKSSKRRLGHRQQYTSIRVKEINVGGN
ncbi:MAG TPA: 50S ribosomal protein L21 [Planctomycetes bacterium]|nr:50S ribosomal protein L21 [Planctomycetota bacterium]